MPILTHFLWQAILTVKFVRLRQFLLCSQGSLVGLCVQDYKCLCAAVVICAAVVNIQTDRQHFDQLI